MDVILRYKKLTTIGGSEGFIIDKAYIKNGLISKDKTYTLTLKETPDTSIKGNPPQTKEEIEKKRKMLGGV